MQEHLSFLEKKTYKINVEFQAQYQNIRLRGDQLVVVSF